MPEAEKDKEAASPTEEIERLTTQETGEAAESAAPSEPQAEQPEDRQAPSDAPDEAGTEETTPPAVAPGSVLSDDGVPLNRSAREGAGSYAQLVLMALVAIVSAAGTGYVLTTRQGAEREALLSEFRASMDQVNSSLASVTERQSASLAPLGVGADSFDDYTRHIKVADTHFRGGRFDEAAASYRAALVLQPQGELSDEAHYRLGLHALEDEDKDAAADHFRKVVIGTPGSRYFARAGTALADLLVQRREFASARRLLYTVIGARNRLDAADQEALTRAYYALGRAYEAEAEALEALRPEAAPAFRFGSDAGGDT